MKLHDMIDRIKEWDDDDPAPMLTDYFDKYSIDALLKLEEAHGEALVGAYLAGMGLFAALVYRYGLPSDLVELFPAAGPAPEPERQDGLRDS